MTSQTKLNTFPSSSWRLRTLSPKEKTIVKAILAAAVAAGREQMDRYGSQSEERVMECPGMTHDSMSTQDHDIPMTHDDTTMQDHNMSMTHDSMSMQDHNISMTLNSMSMTDFNMSKQDYKKGANHVKKKMYLIAQSIWKKRKM